MRAERGELRKEVTRLGKEVARRGNWIVELDKRLHEEKQRSESTGERTKKLSRESLRLPSGRFECGALIAPPVVRHPRQLHRP